MQPLSIHLTKNAFTHDTSIVHGITTLMNTVRHIVEPTTAYHSEVKSANSPEKIGNCSKMEITPVQLALIRKRSSPVETN